jgi:hypothetical protein
MMAAPQRFALLPTRALPAANSSAAVGPARPQQSALLVTSSASVHHPPSLARSLATACTKDEKVKSRGKKSMVVSVAAQTAL